MDLRKIPIFKNLSEDEIKEIQDMSQRLHVAKMLSEGKVFNEVIKETGSSSATISRVNKCLMYGPGGYRMALDRIKE